MGLEERHQEAIPHEHHQINVHKQWVVRLNPFCVRHFLDLFADGGRVDTLFVIGKQGVQNDNDNLRDDEQGFEYSIWVLSWHILIL